MNEPGRTDWEGMATATRAAAAGEYIALAYAKVSPSLSQVRHGAQARPVKWRTIFRFLFSFAVGGLWS
jgi:hypothetical protein